MPKENNCTKLIPSIYKKKYEDIGMFFFIEGQKQIIPTITIFKAIRNYYKFIGEDIYNENASRVIFSRMRESFIDLNYETAQKNSGHTKA